MRGAALAVAICATCAAQWRGRSVKNTRSSEDDPLAAKFSWIPSNDAFALNKIAQASQNKEGVEYLIDKEGYRPLHLAAQQGFVEVVQSSCGWARTRTHVFQTSRPRAG